MPVSEIPPSHVRRDTFLHNGEITFFKWYIVFLLDFVSSLMKLTTTRLYEL